MKEEKNIVHTRAIVEMDNRYFYTMEKILYDGKNGRVSYLENIRKYFCLVQTFRRRFSFQRTRFVLENRNSCSNQVSMHYNMYCTYKTSPIHCT